MKFAIGPKTIFEDAGFKTDAWRHSIDGETVLCHAEYAATLLDLSAHPEITVHDRNSDAFQDILTESFTETNTELFLEEEILTEETGIDAPVEENPPV